MNDINHTEYCHACISAGGDEDCEHCEHNMDGYPAAVNYQKKGGPYCSNSNDTTNEECK